VARLEVRVTPKARRPGVVGRQGDVLKVRVAAAPEAGKANKELVALVAAFLGVRPGAVKVLRGATARYKMLEIEGRSESELAAALARLPS
jgi:uncharacterized protein (TIGR00251 family)